MARVVEALASPGAIEGLQRDAHDFVGLLLTYQFMQLFVVAVNLAASAVGARLFTAGRRAVAVAAVALVALIVWQAGLAQGQGEDEA